MKAIIFYIDHTAPSMFIEKTNEDGEKSIAISTTKNFVTRNELIARIIETDNIEDAEEQVDEGHKYYNIEKYQPLKAGSGIYFDEFSRTFRTTEYGFAIFDKDNSKIRLLSPLKIEKNKLSAYYIVFPSKFKKIPKYKDVEEKLFQHNIITFVDKDVIDKHFNSIDVNKPKIKKILVAKGREPIHGHDEYFIPLMKFEKKAGKVLENGSIDFKEIDSIIDVEKGQDILSRIPRVKPENGYDIHGEPIVAENEKKKGYKIGKNIIKGHNEIFVAGIDGCLDVDGKKVSISPIAVIRGNVDYDSGNIDFNGSVHILGSILPGFSVKARGDIVVENNVDDAELEAGGNITVKLGVTGKTSCRVIAGGKVKAGYILNSYVEAVNEIEVDDSIINSHVFSNDTISAIKGHGKIIGGDTIARHDIVVNVVGSQKEVTTNITVGKSLFVEREIIGIRKEMAILREKVEASILKLKTSFGEEVFKKPKEFLQILPPVKKKNCLILLKELSENNKKTRELVHEKDEAEKKLKLDREPSIKILDSVFPGSVAKIKNQKMLIEKVQQNVKIYEDPQLRVIKIGSAV